MYPRCHERRNKKNVTEIKCREIIFLLLQKKEEKKEKFFEINFIFSFKRRKSLFILSFGGGGKEGVMF